MPNVSRLLIELGYAERKLTELRKKVSEIKSLRQDLIERCTSTLVENHEVIHDLSKPWLDEVVSRDHHDLVQDSIEAKDSFINLAKMSMSNTSSEMFMSYLASQSLATDSGSLLPKPSEDVASSNIVMDQDINDENDPSLINKAYSIELSEEIFMGVPASIRGRAKHASAVSLLRCLSSKYDPKTKKYLSMPISSLDKIGCKVTGKTGESLIAALKALDMIQVSKQGIAYKATVSIRPPSIRGKRASMKPLDSLN